MTGAGAPEQTFVIVGAGQAGAWVARTLRSEGFPGRIVLIGDEAHAPYERPPLSKAILDGSADLASATLLHREAAEAQRIQHWSECVVDAIDLTAKLVALADGRTLGYDHLFLTTGSSPRSLVTCAHDLRPDRVHVLRTADDAQRLRAALTSSRRLAVIGGGWIGLEVAATARRLGLEVLVIEAGPRLCARSVPPAVSDYLLTLHESKGVAVHLSVSVDDIHPQDETIVIESGTGRHVVDHAVIGIGVIPATGLAEAAGLRVENGIVVDDCGRSSDPAVSAAGDVTSHPNAFVGGHVRLESWANAQNQAIVAAKAALGQTVCHNSVSWVWSDQYDANIQIIGSPERASEILVRGDPIAAGGCWLGLDSMGRVVGGVSVNAPKELRLVRKAIEARSLIDKADWASTEIAINKVRVRAI